MGEGEVEFCRTDEAVPICVHFGEPKTLYVYIFLLTMME